MGKPGRAPQPTKLKLVHGNPGKRPLNANEPTPPVPDAVPYAPRHLNAEAKKEWRRVTGILMDLGLYTELDRAGWAMLCQAWGRWVVAERELQERGEILISAKGYMYQNPWRHEANKAQEQMRRMMTEFGMTPSSRSRFNLPGEQEGPSLADQLFAMVSAGAEADNEEADGD